MNGLNRKAAGVMAAIVAGGMLSAAARADVDLQAKADEIVKSMVPVEYTLRTENASEEESGPGLVVASSDGKAVILIAGSLIPESLPQEWLKDIKIRLPGKNYASVSVQFLGRTRNRAFAFLKTTEKVDLPVFQPGDIGEAKLGQQVFSAARAGKDGNYETMVGVSRVKAVLHLTHTIYSTDSFGLTRGTAPVYDLASGQMVGLTMPSAGDSMNIRAAEGGPAQRIALIDDDQTSIFLPRSEIENLFKHIPTDVFDEKRAWLAVDQVTGLDEDVREGKGITQAGGVMIGAVIPGEAADKAGVKPRDIVLTIDGQPFTTSSVPEVMVAHFTRALEDKKPGDVVTLGILRDGKNEEIKVTMGALPKMGAEMAHVFSPRVGLVTRDLTFADLYQRRLPTDTKGVYVALVKNGSPAALGTTPLHSGMLVTKVDDEVVDNQKDFLKAIDKESAKPDLKEMVFSVILPNGETQVCRVDMTK